MRPVYKAIITRAYRADGSLFNALIYVKMIPQEGSYLIMARVNERKRYFRLKKNFIDPEAVVFHFMKGFLTWNVEIKSYVKFTQTSSFTSFPLLKQTTK